MTATTLQHIKTPPRRQRSAAICPICLHCPPPAGAHGGGRCPARRSARRRRGAYWVDTERTQHSRASFGVPIKRNRNPKRYGETAKRRVRPPGFTSPSHSLHLRKCKKDKALTGQKYAHQNSNTTTPIHAGLSARNSPSMGKIRQERKNTPCAKSRYLSHLSAFLCTCTVHPAKNVANDMTA